MAFHKMALPIMLLLSSVYLTSAIKCYYCTSANNTACLDPLSYDPETRALVLAIVNCEDDRVLNVDKYDFFCRKSAQTIYRPNLEAEIRVTRGCGWIRHAKPCYRADSYDHLETACQCFTDYCNNAFTVIPNRITTLAIVLGVCLYLYR